MSEQIYEIRKAVNGRPYWVVKGKNGEVLATSETYERVEDAIGGACAAGAKEAEIHHVSEAPDRRLDLP